MQKQIARHQIEDNYTVYVVFTVSTVFCCTLVQLYVQVVRLTGSVDMFK